MKIKVYIRAGRGRNGTKVTAATRPNYYPLVESRRGTEHLLPTAMFAIEVDIPESAFKHAEQVAASVRLDVDAAQVLVEPPEGPAA